MSRKHSCKRVAQLLSQSLDEPIGLLDQIQLHIHLVLCGNCRNVQAHLHEMRKLSQDLFASDAGFGDGPTEDRTDSRGLHQG